MGTPIKDKLYLWSRRDYGVKNRFRSEMKPPVTKREDVPDLQISKKMVRGGKAQKLRMKYYGSIDVDYDKLYAGEMEGTIEDAVDKLQEMGYRNNPTAYVEVTEEYGPDDGSYARQYITESEAKIDRPHATNFPSVFRRIKNQVHVCIWQVNDTVKFLAHDELSAWLQPMRHVTISEGNASVGVRDFRDDWYDALGEELGGKDKVMWPTTH